MNETEQDSLRDFSDFNVAEKAQLFLWTCILAAGVLGNVAVMWRVLVDQRMRSPTYILLACMALADFLYAVIYVPVVAISIDLFKLKIKSDRLLHFLKFLNNTAVCSAAYHLVVLSVIRYRILIHPLKSRVSITKRKALLLSLGTWLFSVAIQGFIIFIFSTLDTNNRMFYAIVGFITVYLIPLLMIIIVNVYKMKSLGRYLCKQNTRQAHERKLTTMIYVIIILYAVLCLPRFIFLFVEHFKRNVVISHLLHISGYFHVLNSCVNPIVYCFQSPAFRNSLKRGMCWCCYVDRRQDPSHLTNHTNYSVVYSNSSDAITIGRNNKIKAVDRRGTIN